MAASRKRTDLPRLVVVAGGILLVFGAGCGKHTGQDSPAGVVTRFDQLMRQGKYEEAAACFAYNTKGARDSTDWNTYSESQRKLIVNKLRDAKAAALKGNAARWTSQQFQVGAVSQSGNTATVELKPKTGTSVQVQVVHEEAGWRILQLPGF